MQTAAPEREVQSSGSLASASFGISQEHAAHIMGILRSTLYSRKALAVLREYGANAWDEHRQAGIPDKPIQVQLPSHFKPTLKIRDFGRGLSEHDVLHLYTQYGESTKRNTNTATGMLGIGCKAGFAYADQFTVTSWHQGVKSVYVAVLDKSNKGMMSKVFEEPCGDETGIEIQIAVKPKDVDEFTREARGLFRYFSPQPNINLPLDTLPRGMTRGFVNDDKTNNDWIAVMGCIPYRLDLTQLKEALVEAQLWDALGKLGGGIYMPMGSVEFSASREELQYTEVTITALVAQIKLLIQEYIDDALTALTRPDVLPWDRRLKATFMHSVLKFPLPPAFKSWVDSGVVLFSREKGAPKTFNLYTNQHDLTSRVNVSQDARILILDDATRTPKGWVFNNSKDVLAVPVAPATYAEVKAEIEAFVLAAEVQGITISPMSTRGWWQSPRQANGRRQYPPNQKHKDRTFTLNAKFRDVSPRSAYWTSVTPPEEEHVFCIIREFTPEGTGGLGSMQEDQALALEFGIPWPTIYGYKTTDNMPVEAKDIEHGIHYTTWRAREFGKLVTAAVKATARDLAWSSLYSNMPYRNRQRGESPFTPRDLVAKLSGTLGEKHPVTRYFAMHVESKFRLTKVTRKWLEQVPKILKAAKYEATRDPCKEWLDRLKAAYPMLKVVASDEVHLACGLLDHYDTITNYIRTCDQTRGSTSAPTGVVLVNHSEEEEPEP